MKYQAIPNMDFKILSFQNGNTTIFKGKKKKRQDCGMPTF